MNEIFAALLCFSVAGLFLAIADIFDNPIRYQASIFRRWPERYFLRNLSSLNAYKKNSIGERIVDHLNRHKKPVYVEKFKWSSSVFAWIFDGYNLARFLHRVAIFTGAAYLTGRTGSGFFFLLTVFLCSEALIRYAISKLLIVSK